MYIIQYHSMLFFKSSRSWQSAPMKISVDLKESTKPKTPSTSCRNITNGLWPSCLWMLRNSTGNVWCPWWKICLEEWTTCTLRAFSIGTSNWIILCFEDKEILIDQLSSIWAWLTISTTLTTSLTSVDPQDISRLKFSFREQEILEAMSLVWELSSTSCTFHLI